MGRIVFGHDQQAAGVLIDPMHDAGTANSTDPGQAIAAMGQQSIDEGAVVMTGGRMDNQTSRFVKHENVRILVANIEGDCLRFEGCGGGE